MLLSTSSPYLFQCLIGPLTPSTTYFYIISAPTSNNTVYTFKTYPAPGDVTPITIGLIADLGMTTNSSSTLDNVILGKPDLVLFAGDLNYADSYGPFRASIFPKLSCTAYNGTSYGTGVGPSNTCGQGGLRWDAWGRFCQKLFAYTPTLFIPGNHEIEAIPQWGYFETFKAYTARIPAMIKSTQVYNPSTHPFSAPNAPFYYSVDIGQVHILAINSFAGSAKYSLQYNFVNDDMNMMKHTTYRNVTPWIVAFLHIPWYNTDNSHYLEGEGLRTQLEGFLYNGGVDLVHVGHVHAYERSHPVYNYNLNACGAVHVTVGDGGNDEGVAGP